MPRFKCKRCGKVGTREELRMHKCPRREEEKKEKDDGLLDLALISLVMDSSNTIGTPDPEPFSGGGGEFSGGGASGEY